MSDKQQITPYPLRIPEDLREKIESSAKRNGRSLNAEIVLRLRASYDFAGELRALDEKEKQTDSLLTELSSRLDRLKMELDEMKKLQKDI